MAELNYEDFKQRINRQDLLADAGYSLDQQHEMAKYLKSLRNEKDIFSGDEDLLPPDLLKAYGKMEAACEEYESARCSRLVCKEDLEDLASDLKAASDKYRNDLKEAVSRYETMEKHDNEEEEEERTYHFRR